MNFLEIQFALGGLTKTLPADHGYALYSAIKQVVQQSDKNLIDAEQIPEEVRLCSIAGTPNKDGKIYMHRRSQFRLRCPADQVQIWYRLLQNQEINLRGHKIRLVRPRLMLPEASEILKARMVTFKLESIDHPELPRYFLESCHKGLDRLEIKGHTTFIPSDDDGNLVLAHPRMNSARIVGLVLCLQQPQSSLLKQNQCESRIKKPMTLKNINLPLTDIQNICERWHIKELALFGSALRSDFHPESDRVRSPLSFPSS
jgi:CRISPR-associated protein Cas6